ncbi:hypothetical protein JCGZ_03166 [Jatropha curcas]|uniref:Uncharacterized protein n=1 Tax=Jatropha curcas TaxID=180498 RepID=A0A067L978_JATCU|nr:hypothetical protein JCGZ_03166 [Jatropha curcas]
MIYEQNFQSLLKFTYDGAAGGRGSCKFACLPNAQFAWVSLLREIRSECNGFHVGLSTHGLGPVLLSFLPSDLGGD